MGLTVASRFVLVVKQNGLLHCQAHVCFKMGVFTVLKGQDVQQRIRNVSTVTPTLTISLHLLWLYHHHCMSVSVNVDIFAGIHFREFAKVDDFMWIYVCVFEISVYIWHNENYFHEINIFADISEM